MIILHGPDGSEHYVRAISVISVHPPTIHGSPTNVGALIYLSNGMQWSVRETVAEVMKLVHG